MNFMSLPPEQGSLYLFGDEDLPDNLNAFAHDPSADACAAEEQVWRVWGPEIPPHMQAGALLELSLLLATCKDDPMAPQNLTRFHPDVDDIPDQQRCVLTGKKSKKKKVYVLVSAARHAYASGFSWNMNNDKSGQRYPRRHPSKAEKQAGRTRTIYLYRDIMAQMLLEDPVFLAVSLKRFGMRSTGNSELDVERLMNRAIVHHRNHNPEDCRDTNLQLATDWENRVQAKDTPGAGGYIGVYRVRMEENGETRFLYRAQVTYLMRKERKRSLRLGTFVTPELALLARTLWMLAHRSVLPHRYTPTEREEPVWRSAWAFTCGEDVCPLFGPESDLPTPIRKYMLYARTQYAKGLTVTLETRC